MKTKYLIAMLFVTLAFSSMAQKEKTTTLSGYTIGYKAANSCGCFFVDKEMVKAGVAKDISSKAGRACYSAKYGKGVSISFEQVPRNAAYTKPAENVLIIAKGYWTTREGKNLFIVKSFEPFF